jgi:hypothetical protein
VRDIREQPQFNDLAIATHGRDVWILDDITALQQLPQAQRAGAMLFKPRTAYEYDMHANDEGTYTRFTGKNPPNGAIIDFYQSAPQTKGPSVEILNAKGEVIRHIPAAKKGNASAEEPYNEYRDAGAGGGVPNEAGINRVVWNFREDGPPQWLGTVPAFRGSPIGAEVPPGKYVARITLNGRTFSQPFEVKADPESPYTQAQLVQAYDFSKKYLAVSGHINTVLNELDAQGKTLKQAQSSLSEGGNAALLAKVNDALKAHDAIFHELTANYKNEEDSIQFPGELREDVPRSGFGGAQPPTPALLEYASRFDKQYNAVMARYTAYSTGVYAPLAAQLKAVGVK